jgi:hypothetical protein
MGKNKTELSLNKNFTFSTKFGISTIPFIRAPFYGQKSMWDGKTFWNTTGVMINVLTYLIYPTWYGQGIGPKYNDHE